MAEFLPAYKLIRKHEGNYVNHALDAGQETYAGVARKFWPTWSGWTVLDELKAQGLKPVPNMFISGLETHVESFYKKLWHGQKFGLIQNQSVADIIFDWFVNSGSSGIKKVQVILRDNLKEEVQVDGELGPRTVTLLNKYRPEDIHELIKEARIDFYNSIVTRKPNQQVFLKGWMNRINSFTFAS